MMSAHRMADDHDSMSRWLSRREGLTVGMLLAFLALLPFGGLYNIPLLVLCGLGLWCLASRSKKEALGDEGLRLLFVLFLCVWLPMAIAAVDAVNPMQAWRKVASFPVFFLGGVWVAMVLRHGIDLQRLLTGVWVICVVWSVDAAWQFMRGFNLLGFPYQGGRLPGIFHPDLRLGVVLATVSPLVLEGMRRLSRRSEWVVLALIPLVAVIALSGSRSSWIVFCIVLVAYGWYLFRWAGGSRAHRRSILRVAAVGVLACVTLGYVAPQAVSRAQEILLDRAVPIGHVLRGDTEADIGIEARLSAWETAGRSFRAHWFNGVGPRGFREVYAEYAPPSDPYVARGSVLHFPHMLVLEVAAETGTVGLLGYLIALMVLVRLFLGMDRAQLARGFPYWLALAVVLFPLTTHMAFYSHFMGALIWWTIAISAVGLGAAMRSGK